MKVILTGATGMVGEGVLLECLANPAVERVLSVVRRPSGRNHPKLVEVIVKDFRELGPVEAQLTGYDACFYCAGISSVGMSEADGQRLLHELLDWATQPQYTYRHTWQIGDTAMWDNTGTMHRVTPFDENKSKGLAIAGKAGDPVLAAADGRVVYAGSGLRGFGNLIIVKHNNTYLTAYAHNQALLVKEDQIVRRGQKIAEMGSTDADRVQLHFEIRRQGKPVDPARLLPAR